MGLKNGPAVPLDCCTMQGKCGLDITRFSTVQGEVGGGQGQNRTADTGIFSPLLYRLSYLAKSQISEERLENSHCN